MLKQKTVREPKTHRYDKVFVMLFRICQSLINSMILIILNTGANWAKNSQ